MSKSFERMWGRLPETLQSESVEKLYTALSKIFDELEEKEKPCIYTTILTELKGKMLDVYGESYSVSRDGKNDENYRIKIKMEWLKNSFVPTLDNFINIIKEVTGYDVAIVEGWNLTEPKKALLNVELTIPSGADTDLLFDLDQLYSCGVKINFKTAQENYTPFEIIGEHKDSGL
ncbi:hypothetical protein, partial [Fusobacterium ulcerans]|uniref:hypothetical protein n=1 Tax=Fusobacterium ulcerans TaxID=861 RepID=UPI002E762702